jgi:hypothetical protein
MSSVTPESTAEFIDGLGVNTHFFQGVTTAPQIIADTAYLGIDNIRDAQVPVQATARTLLAVESLAAAGLKFDFVTAQSIGASLAFDDALEAVAPGSIRTLEGPNEVNNFAFGYQGLGGNLAAALYQAELYAAVQADPALAGVSIVNFTSSPYRAAPADASNAHPYPKNGIEPWSLLSQVYTLRQNQQPGLPVDFTETGYSSTPVAGVGGVDLLTQAKLTLNDIFDAAALGAQMTYLYDLMDDASDPSGQNLEAHFGLFTHDGVAKPSAVAVHNLTTILGGAGGGGGDFTPTALNFTIDGLPSDGRSLLLQKSANVYDLVIWAEPQVWNAQTGTAVVNAPVNVTVNLDQAAQVDIFDPLVSSDSTGGAASTQTVSLAVTDHPLIVQVTTFAAAQASLASSAAPAAASSWAGWHTSAPLLAAPR